MGKFVEKEKLLEYQQEMKDSNGNIVIAVPLEFIESAETIKIIHCEECYHQLHDGSCCYINCGGDDKGYCYHAKPKGKISNRKEDQRRFWHDGFWRE